jgi:hypothetical protein
LQRAWQKLGAPFHRRRLQELVILSMPRTGSSYLGDCLSSMPGTLVLREIFNPRGRLGVLKLARAKRELEALLGKSLEESADPQLQAYFTSQPLDAIEIVARAAADERNALMVYKIINHQLERSQLETVLVQRKPEVIVLVRQRLDVWVSLRKAATVGKWHHQDTRAIEIGVDVDEFVDWFKDVDDWYRWVMDVTAQLGLRTLVLDYDRHLDHPPDKMRRSITGWLGELQITLPSSPPRDSRPRDRQDAATDPFSKVTNGVELRANLIECGLLDYALSPPLADRIRD